MINRNARKFSIFPKPCHIVVCLFVVCSGPATDDKHCFDCFLVELVDAFKSPPLMVNFCIYSALSQLILTLNPGSLTHPTMVAPKNASY